MIEIERTHHWHVYGHDWAVDYLHKGIVNDRIRQAYLITGMPSIGKTRFAHSFAAALNCSHSDPAQRPCGECRSCRMLASGNHPDMVYSELDTTTGALKIENLRSVMQRLALKPYEARYRIAIVSDFDRARFSSQDAILKTLEEPPAHAILILLAPSTEKLMPTIISRCQVIHLKPVPVATVETVLVEQYSTELEQAALIARLSGGRIGWAIDAARQPETLSQRDEALNLLEDCLKMNRKDRFELAQALSRDKQALYPLLELWQTYWRDVLLLTEESPVRPSNSDRLTNLQQLVYNITGDDALKALRATRTLMGQLSTNVNLRLALEVMFLDYPGLSR